MFGNLKKLTLLISVSTMFLGCAQPKYVNASPSDEQGSQQENKATCSTQLQKSGYCVSWIWEKKPTDSEMGSLIFKIYRLNQYDESPVAVDTSATPQVVLWMPSMGHGSSPTTVTKLDTGTYRASNVFFVMPGEWQIKLQIKDGTTVEDEAVISLTI